MLLGEGDVELALGLGLLLLRLLGLLGGVASELGAGGEDGSSSLTVSDVLVDGQAVSISETVAASGHCWILGLRRE